jgi:hypothetical protein
MQCSAKALLIVTREIAGTATNIADRRVTLSCSLQAGHDGPHKDTSEAEEWEGSVEKSTTVLRHEK